MSTKIGLVSDVHATPAPLQEALSIFAKEGVDMILCAGDIAGYGQELEQTVALLMASACKAIFGNHEIWHLEAHGNDEENRVNFYFRNLPPVLDLVIEGKKLYMVHASPPQSCMDGIKLLDHIQAREEATVHLKVIDHHTQKSFLNDISIRMRRSLCLFHHLLFLEMVLQHHTHRDEQKKQRQNTKQYFS